MNLDELPKWHRNLHNLIGKWDSEVPARQDETTLLLILQAMRDQLAALDTLVDELQCHAHQSPELLGPTSGPKWYGA